MTETEARAVLMYMEGWLMMQVNETHYPAAMRASYALVLAELDAAYRRFQREGSAVLVQEGSRPLVEPDVPADPSRKTIQTT